MGYGYGTVTVTGMATATGMATRRVARRWVIEEYARGIGPKPWTLDYTPVLTAYRISATPASRTGPRIPGQSVATRIGRGAGGDRVRGQIANWQKPGRGAGRDRTGLADQQAFITQELDRLLAFDGRRSRPLYARDPRAGRQRPDLLAAAAELGGGEKPATERADQFRAAVLAKLPRSTSRKSTSGYVLPRLCPGLLLAFGPLAIPHFQAAIRSQGT